MNKSRWYHRLFSWRKRRSEKDVVEQRHRLKALKTPSEKILVDLVEKGELFWGPERFRLSPVTLDELKHDILSGKKRVYVMRERPDGSYKYTPVRSPSWHHSAYRRWLIQVRKDPSIKFRHFASLGELEHALPRKVYYFQGQADALNKRLEILEKQIELAQKKGQTDLLESLIWSRNATKRKQRVILKWSKEAHECVRAIRLYKQTQGDLEKAIKRETHFSKEVEQFGKLSEPDEKLLKNANREIRTALVRQLGLRARMLAEEIDIYEKYGYSFSKRKFADLVRSHEILSTNLLKLAHYVQKLNKSDKKNN